MRTWVLRAVTVVGGAGMLAGAWAGTAMAGTVSVPANQSGGVSGGIFVSAGDEVTVTASGTAQYGYEGDPSCTGYPTTKPDGSRSVVVNGSVVQCSKKDDPNAKLSGGAVGELIARVGSGPWFAVGTYADWTSSVSGALYLAYNDSIYTDNTGSYTATVSRIFGGGGGGGGGGGCDPVCPT